MWARARENINISHDCESVANAERQRWKKMIKSRHTFRLQSRQAAQTWKEGQCWIRLILFALLSLTLNTTFLIYIGRFTKIMLIGQLTEEINFIVSARHEKWKKTKRIKKGTNIARRSPGFVVLSRTSSRSSSPFTTRLWVVVLLQVDSTVKKKIAEKSRSGWDLAQKMYRADDHIKVFFCASNIVWVQLLLLLMKRKALSQQQMANSQLAGWFVFSV